MVEITGNLRAMYHGLVGVSVVTNTALLNCDDPIVPRALTEHPLLLLSRLGRVIQRFEVCC